MKSSFLYHGSPKLIEGNILPMKANGLQPEENLKAVYASDFESIAAVMGFLKSISAPRKLVLLDAEKEFKIPRGIVYSKNFSVSEKIYLYTLNANEFMKCTKAQNQYFSEKPVSPSNIREVYFEEYKDFIERASPLEIKLHSLWGFFK